jgi:hypothetical protein
MVAVVVQVLVLPATLPVLVAQVVAVMDFKITLHRLLMAQPTQAVVAVVAVTIPVIRPVQLAVLVWLLFVTLILIQMLHPPLVAPHLL